MLDRVGLIAAALSVSAAQVLAQTVTVPQGGVGRWSGEGTTRCAMDGRSWKAIEGACWYPIDFERRPGRVEIARWRGEGAIEKGWLTVEDKVFEKEDITLPDDTFVHLSPENLARLYREQAEIKPLFKRRGGDARFTLPLGKPADPLPEGKSFGVTRTFNGEPKNSHTGVDYGLGAGTPVRSVADGTVALIGDHFFGGNSVYVYHGDGLVSMYFHLSEIKVAAGQEVKRGDEMGVVGSTGRSTGPHLHLGVRWHGARVDPSLLIGPVDAVPQVTEAGGGGGP